MNIHIEGDHIQIQGSSIGEGNLVMNGAERDSIAWERLQEGLLRAMQKLPVGSAEYEAGSQALGSVLKHDKLGLVKCAKELAVSFSSGLFASAAGPFLTEYIQNLLK